MGSLSSWVSVNPVHWRLRNVGQDLNKKNNTKLRNINHSSSPCSEKEDALCLTWHRRSAPPSSPSHSSPSPPPWPRTPLPPSLPSSHSMHSTQIGDALPNGWWLRQMLKENIFNFEQLWNNLYSLILFFCPGFGGAPSDTLGLGHPETWHTASTPCTTKCFQ